MLWAEGPTVVERLVGSGLPVSSVLVTPPQAERLDAVLAAIDAPVLIAALEVIEQVVGFSLHRGAIAVASRPAPVTVGDLGARVVALEGVNDPENLGAIGRSARALGVDGLLLDPTCADPWYRRSVRVSMGELLVLPVARAPLGAALDELGAAGAHVWALTPSRAAESIVDLVAGGVPERLVLVAGAEGPGLSDAVLARHRRVRIPIRDDVDSLNVGHAVTAALAVVQTARP